MRLFLNEGSRKYRCAAGKYINNILIAKVNFNNQVTLTLLILAIISNQ